MRHKKDSLKKDMLKKDILKTINIEKNILIIDRALFLSDERILVISDTHIGYEDSIEKMGVLTPKSQIKKTIERLDNILTELNRKTGIGKAETIIINGDIKDAFGKITDAEWREVRMFLKFVDEKADNIILIKGNHDTHLGPIARKEGHILMNKYEQGRYCFMHGDNEYETNKEVIIIGHEHPALTLREGARKESFKCFLHGKKGRQTMIVLPSFNVLAEGHSVFDNERWSPVLPRVDDFSAIVCGEEPLLFGKIKDLKDKFY